MRSVVTTVRALLPRLGLAGSRSAHLHENSPATPPGDSSDLKELDGTHRIRFRWAVTIGTVGTLMIAFGGLGAGAWPVLHNPVWQVPFIGSLTRMLHSTTVLVFCGIALLCLAWILLARFCVTTSRRDARWIPVRSMWRVFALWVTPLIFTAPLFTQDIYSYLAQGSIAARGWDPYSAGPVDLLGQQDPLARSVPLLWSHSPAPYGPTALGYGAVISRLTGNSIVWGLFAHRLVSVVSVILIGWSLVRLARRCAVPAQTALWLGVLNPLALLHLIGGIHNEAVMLGFLLAGMELVLRGVDSLERPTASRWILIVGGVALITVAGLVKVTAFMALGFAGVAVAVWRGGAWRNLISSAILTATITGLVIVALSMGTGVGFGWITSQGGATSVLSWMSVSTLVGLTSSALGMLLGLGDHQQTAVHLTQSLGIIVGAAWVLRMLWASFQERIHPLGGLGVAMFLLVIFFPVVHPWYLLWALLPLAAWANRELFILIAAAYSLAFSFFILPKGLSLPPSTVLYIYVMVALTSLAAVAIARLMTRKRPGLREVFAIGQSLPHPQHRALLAHAPKAVR